MSEFYTLDESAVNRIISEIKSWQRIAKKSGYDELHQFLANQIDVMTAMRDDTDRINKLQAAQIIKCHDVRHYIDNQIPDLTYQKD